MNSDILYNPYQSSGYYFPSVPIYQQQLIPFMIIQQENVPMYFTQINYDWRAQPINICTNCKQNVPEIQEIDQNNHQTLVELRFQEKSPSTEQDSQGRGNGHWTNQEHLKYLVFVKSHQSTFKSKYEKKSKKIFKLMSEFIPTRTAIQCRSHHQKFNPLKKGKKKFKQPFGYTPYK